MLKKLCLYLCLCSVLCTHLSAAPVYQVIANLEEYPYNPAVPLDLWQKLEPYFLPTDHPIKRKLDKIFTSTRAILSKETLLFAGFKNIKERKYTHVVFAKHPKLKGYVIKTYLDTQHNTNEWSHWIARILGARSIQTCIQRHGYTQFKVPQKWLYPLPIEPQPPFGPGYHPKHFILIAEDMDILNEEANNRAFQTKMTPQLLDKLFVIITEEGLWDSNHPSNIPFTQEGKIAFVDTEQHHLWPIDYLKLKKYLGKDMQEYWQGLVDRYQSTKNLTEH